MERGCTPGRCVNPADPHLAAEAADKSGVPPLVREQARNRLSALGDDRTVIAQIVQQGQALLLELGRADSFHRSAPGEVSIFYVGSLYREGLCR